MNKPSRLHVASCITTAVLLAPLSVAAQDEPGLYVNLFTGLASDNYLDRSATTILSG